MTAKRNPGPASSRNSRRIFTPDRLSFVPRLLAGMIRLLHGSCRFTLLNQEHETAALRTNPAVIYTTWHFAFPAVIYHFRDRNGLLMVSRSRDGEWVARLLHYLGYPTVRGSAGKGGGMALRQMIAHFRAGYPGGFIADGSQGPPQVAQKGILILARHTGVPLIPVSMAAAPCWRFRSWDRTVLARPFAHIVLAFGAPIRVDPQATPDQIEDLREDLEDSLNRLTRQARAALHAGNAT